MHNPWWIASKFCIALDLFRLCLTRANFNSRLDSRDFQPQPRFAISIEEEEEEEEEAGLPRREPEDFISTAWHNKSSS